MWDLRVFFDSPLPDLCPKPHQPPNWWWRCWSPPGQHCSWDWELREPTWCKDLPPGPGCTAPPRGNPPATTSFARWLRGRWHLKPSSWPDFWQLSNLKSQTGLETGGETQRAGLTPQGTSQQTLRDGSRERWPWKAGFLKCPLRRGGYLLMLAETTDLREKQSLENCRPASRRPRNGKTLKTITLLS